MTSDLNPNFRKNKFNESHPQHSFSQVYIQTKNAEINEKIDALIRNIDHLLEV